MTENCAPLHDENGFHCVAAYRAIVGENRTQCIARHNATLGFTSESRLADDRMDVTWYVQLPGGGIHTNFAALSPPPSA